MNLPNQNNENECPPRASFVAYIDGELFPREELGLEAHLAACRACASELNEQKRLLRALDFFASENERAIKLPESFTKTVVASAESRVKGLRCPRERSRAVFVVVALFLMFIICLGGETKSVVAIFLNFGEQILAVGGFAAHLVFNLAVGATIILRSICAQLVRGSAASSVFLTAFFFVSVFALRRLLVGRFKRA
ncbi:MAG: zf-HC2 domain-containing protein [Acidobacteria bacterium]|jgi:anti-sigma factor RsiW|nr:zf-HC2 domain-containing protein [Acidobacteriota bacterium]